MTIEYKQSLTEINTIINYMDIENVRKIPQKFIEFIKQNMDSTYIPNISKNIPINEQNIKKDTKILLSLIYRDYLCEADKKKQLIQNEIEEKRVYEQELKEKYNPNNIFKNTHIVEQTNDMTNEVSLIEYKENDSWYKKIIFYIKKIWLNIFKKGN